MQKDNYINIDPRFNTYDDRCQYVVVKEGAYYAICEHISEWRGITYEDEDFLTEPWIDKLGLTDELIDDFLTEGHIISRNAVFLISGVTHWSQKSKIECTRIFLTALMNKDHLK